MPVRNQRIAATVWLHQDLDKATSQAQECYTTYAKSSGSQPKGEMPAACDSSGEKTRPEFLPTLQVTWCIRHSEGTYQ